MCKTESKPLNNFDCCTPRLHTARFFNPRFPSIPQTRSHYFCLHITYHHENRRRPLPSPLNAPPALIATTPPQCQSMTTPFPTVRPAVCKKIHRGCRLIKKARKHTVCVVDLFCSLQAFMRPDCVVVFDCKPHPRRLVTS